MKRLGLRPRLAAAVGAVALISVGLATFLANRGLDDPLQQSRRERVTAAATHLTALARELIREDGAWTPAGAREISHASALVDLRARVIPAARPTPRGPLTVVSPLTAGGDRLVVEPRDPARYAKSDEHLGHRLNRLHLVAGALALALGLAAAIALASALSHPLRRLAEGARRLQGGDLDTRVAAGGGPEIEQVGAALNRLAETLQLEDALRREATADIAHELRTPLSGILSRIEAAEDDVIENRAANLRAMHDEARRLNRLVEDLGQLAEAQQPGLLLERQAIDLADVADERVRSVRARFAARQIELVLHAEPSPVLADPGRMAQVLDNLLSNALRYTDPGGRVVVTTQPRAGRIVLDVADDGIGIAADELPRIFDRFWRSDKSRARTRGGAGIGLAIVEALVRSHDGHISVVSEVDRGTTVSVSLPARSDDR